MSTSTDLRLFILITLGALVSCDGPTPSPSGAPGELAVRAIPPRGSPRVPFLLDLKAEALGAEDCEVRVLLRSPQGGAACVEFSLPSGVEATDGELRRDCRLEPGEAREERIVVRVAPGEHRLLRVEATVGGFREEGYVEFGEPPTAGERGLRTRTTGAGDRALRLGPEDLPGR